MDFVNASSDIHVAASLRWFTPVELNYILQSYQEVGISICDSKIFQPTNGSFFIFAKANTHLYKNDGIDWVKRKGRDSVREDMVKLMHNGQHIITGRMCSIEEMPKRVAIETVSRLSADTFNAIPHEDDAMDGLDEELVNDLINWNNNAEPNFNCASSMLTQDTINEIVDFEPKYANGNDLITNILICLKREILDARIKVLFGDTCVEGEILSPYCVRCAAPSLTTQSQCFLILQNSNGQIISMQSNMCYSFLSISHISSLSNINTSLNSSYEKLSCSEKSVLSDAAIFSQVRHDVREESAMEISEQVQNEHFTNMHHSDDIVSITSDLPERKQKVRLLERLESVAAAIGGTKASKNQRRLSKGLAKGFLSAQNDDANSHVMINRMESTQRSDDWLDDKALGALSLEDLKTTMDRLIQSFMSQLVLLASVDTELKHELNSLDASGFALLHYCSLYNLLDLVDMLLLKSATDVNILSTSGTTALHLAAGAGHDSVVERLVEHGADVTLLDSEGLNALNRAVEGGHGNIAVYLENVMIHDSKSDGSARHGLVSNQSESTVPVVIKIENGGEVAHDITKVPKGIGGSPLMTLRSSSDRLSPRPFNISDESVSLTGGNAANINLLQAALSSLSLTDKCALSLSLGQSSISPNKSIPYASDADDLYNIQISPGISEISNISLPGEPSGLPSAKLFDDLDSMLDSQSVWSETEQESLDVAMSLMGPSEIAKVEQEVKLIQNNVRAWILRKNYTNLREAARVLQTAWRERRKEGNQLSSPTQVISRDSKKRRMADMSPERIGSASDRESVIENSLFTSEAAFSNDLVSYDTKLSSAAAKMQARTRGMLARRSFSIAKRQAMASLVIQKNLLMWWMHNKQSAHDVIGEEKS